jgi:hypothetical protein
VTTARDPAAEIFFSVVEAYDDLRGRGDFIMQGAKRGRVGWRLGAGVVAAGPTAFMFLLVWSRVSRK